MIKCLAIISLLFCLLSCPTFAQTEDETAEYSVVIDANGKQQITGICVISESEDGNIIGTIVNEFGMKAFDFTFNGKKAKLQNVFPPINKWYIRKVLRKDIAFLLSHIKTRECVVEDKRRITFATDGVIMLTNKYNITYTFNPLNDKQ